MTEKEMKDSVSKGAKDYFDQGFNWAESISLSFREFLGRQGSLLPRLASGFGGGIARKGSVCGALTGAVMVLGMKMGRTDPKDRETLTKLYAKAREMWDRFEKQFDSCICFDLTGCHFDNEEERQKWLASGGHEKCTRIVENTARALCEVMEGPG